MVTSVPLSDTDAEQSADTPASDSQSSSTVTGPESTRQATPYPPCSTSIRPPASAFDDVFIIQLFMHDKAFTIIRYVFHKGLLAFYSPVFKSYVERGGTDSRKLDMMNGDDIDRETLDHVKAWLYTGNIDTVDENGALQRASTALLCKLWVFGERYTMPALQNSCINALHWQLHNNKAVLPYDHYDYIWDSTDAASGISRLFLDFVTQHPQPLSPSDLRYAQGGLYTPLLQQLLCHRQDPWFSVQVSHRLKRPCSYHIHTDGHDCNGLVSWRSSEEKTSSPSSVVKPQQALMQYLAPSIAGSQPEYFVIDHVGYDGQAMYGLWPDRSSEEQRLVDYNAGYRFPETV